MPCPCDTSLFLLPALHALQQVSTPGVSFQLELSAFPTCATTQQPLWGSPWPAALSLVSPKLQSPHLGPGGQRVRRAGGSGVFPTCLCCVFLSCSWNLHRHLVLTAV